MSLNDMALCSHRNEILKDRLVWIYDELGIREFQTYYSTRMFHAWLGSFKVRRKQLNYQGFMSGLILLLEKFINKIKSKFS
jgi:hypothetical protein